MATSLSRHAEASEYPEFVAEKKFLAERLEMPSEEVLVFHDSSWSDTENGELIRERFELTLEVLGIHEVAREQILNVAKEATESGWKHDEPLGKYSGTYRLYSILIDIADRGALDERVNDFTVSTEIRLDDRLSAIVRYKSEEAGILCNECSDGKAMGDLMAEFDGESCEHFEGRSDYKTDFSITLAVHDPELPAHHRICNDLWF